MFITFEFKDLISEKQELIIQNFGNQLIYKTIDKKPLEELIHKLFFTISQYLFKNLLYLKLMKPIDISFLNSKGVEVPNLSGALLIHKLSCILGVDLKLGNRWKQDSDFLIIQSQDLAQDFNEWKIKLIVPRNVSPLMLRSNHLLIHELSPFIEYQFNHEKPAFQNPNQRHKSSDFLQSFSFNSEDLFSTKVLANNYKIRESLINLLLIKIQLELYTFNFCVSLCNFKNFHYIFRQMYLCHDLTHIKNENFIHNFEKDGILIISAMTFSCINFLPIACHYIESSNNQRYSIKFVFIVINNLP